MGAHAAQQGKRHVDNAIARCPARACRLHPRPPTTDRPRSLDLSLRAVEKTIATLLPSARAAVVWSALPDGAVLFATDTEVYYSLNPVGTLIWELLPRVTSLDELCAAVHAEYPDATPLQVRADVVELLDDLERAGLVEWKG